MALQLSTCFLLENLYIHLSLCYALPSNQTKSLFRGARLAIDGGSHIQINEKKPSTSMSFLGLDFYSDLHFAGRHRGDIVAQVYTFDMRLLTSEAFISSSSFDYAPCIIAPNLIILPQGKLNIKFGHIWHAYGLRNQINTTQTLRQLISADSMGLMLDWGAELHGELDIFSYNVSIGSGSGKWFSRQNDTYMSVVRLGIHGDHPFFAYQPFNIGLSALSAKIQSPQGLIERWRGGLDIQYHGPIGLLFEGSIGEDRNVVGDANMRDALTALAEVHWRSRTERWMFYLQQRYVSYRIDSAEDSMGNLPPPNMPLDIPNMTTSSALTLPYKQSSTLGVLYTPLRSLYLASELVVDNDKSQLIPRAQVRYRW